MKKDRILNPNIIWAIASIGHTEYLCISDCGLPIPTGVQVVDVSIRAGLPSFIDLLEAVSEELVVESIVTATEMDETNPALVKQIHHILGENIKHEKITHQEFKQKVANAKFVIRTGETTPYANIILVGGVNF